MSILLNNFGGDNQPWLQALSFYLPDMPIYIYPDIPDRNAIKYAVVWHHPHGDLLKYPNLKAILVLGAGMDHIDAEPLLPNVPIVRLIDPAVNDDMAQYALYWTMHFHRGYERYRDNALVQHWQRHESQISSEYVVSVLGAGRIGTFVSSRLALNGYAVKNWSRSGADIKGVDCFAGADGMREILKQTQVLVVCLPYNSGTHHLLTAEHFRQLPEGASVINLSRGAVIEDAALLNAIDDEHLAAAALDVFVEEPLPKSSPYWHRDNVYVTPHMAGGTYARSAANVIADNIRRMEQGQLPFPIYTTEPK